MPILITLLAFFLLRSTHISESKVVYIESGLGINKLAGTLKQEKIIKSKLVFKSILILLGKDKKIKHGEYAFVGENSLFEIIDIITSGKYYYRKIIIPECSTVEEVVEIVSNNRFLSGKINRVPDEGSIYPDTYFFQRNDDKNKIIDRMQNKMDKVVNSIWQESNTTLRSKKELIKLASIVEAEAILKNEKYIISGVFYNRINKKMKLQSDPTVLYKKNLNNSVKTRKIYKKDLITDNPWNTYTRTGLPLTPICNPGLDAIKAAMMPKNTKYLYFVVNGIGGHRFSIDFKQHLKNIQYLVSRM